MGAKLSAGTAIDGVIAYQDDTDPKQFHYIPARADLVLGDTLLDFEVDYWGVNSKAYNIQTDDDIINSVGGILSGRARIDITTSQRKNIVNAIKSAYSMSDDPKLLPLILQNVKAQPIIAQFVIDYGDKKTVTFPTSITLGTTFAYLVGSGNSLFATLAAGTSNNPAPRPAFSINVTGDVEFVGDPWEAEISCDLSQVWNYSRTQVSGGVSFGFFSLGASYDSIVQDLVRNNIIKIKYKEGSMASAVYARQFLDATKKVFDAINAQAVAGEGFFKFDPNPNPQGGGSGGGGGGGSSWWGWSVSINASYSSQTFKQTISFNQTVTYSGRVLVPMGTAMSLAVGCGSDTKKYFNDFQDVSNSCLTQAKTDGLQARLGAEKTAKNAKALAYLEKLENGDWTETKYRKLMAILRTITLTDNFAFAKHKPEFALKSHKHAIYQKSLSQVEAELTKLEQEKE